MPLVSALNGDNRNIPAGAPVAGKSNRLLLDRVILAGGSVLAAGVVTSGAVPGGVINLQTDGVIDIADWSHVTPSKYLTVGATYRLSSQSGQMTTSPVGQIVGLAVSKTQLSLQLGGASSGSQQTGSVTSLAAALQVETSARASADASLAGVDSFLQTQITSLQTQVTELQQPRYSTALLLES